MYYKNKRVSVKRGNPTSIKQLQKTIDGREFLKMIGFSDLPEESVQSAGLDRDLETVAPEQTEAIKAKVRSFKITEEWARKER